MRPALVLCLAACHEPCPDGEVEDAFGDCVRPGEIAPVEPNNQAVLEGARFPDEDDDASARKVVPLTLSGTGWGDDLVFGDAVVARRGDDHASLLVAVHNEGPTRCFLRLDTIAYHGPSGALATSDFDYVAGSVGELSTVHTSSCVASGQTGYFLDIVELDWQAVEEVTATRDAPNLDGRPSPARAIPTGYTAEGGAMRLTVEHQAGPDLEAPIGHLVWLDADGTPLDWTFSTWESESLALGAGETREMRVISTSTASATRFWHQVDFQPAEAARSATRHPDELAARARKLATWRAATGE